MKHKSRVSPTNGWLTGVEATVTGIRRRYRNFVLLWDHKQAGTQGKS